MARYAIYYLPHEPGDLARFGASILGYDVASGMDVPYPDHPVFADPAALGWTAAPRRYGFHATLKAPFRLAAGRAAEELVSRLEAFAAERRAFSVELKLTAMGDFLALVAADPPPALQRLADDCVRTFDPYRAPLSPFEHERRHPDRLAPRERENLEQWGYPHVFDAFRFHMTLTGSLDVDDRVRLEPVLHDMFQLITPSTPIDAVSLLRQDDDEGRFVLQRRFPFGRD